MSKQTAVEWLIENYWPLKRGLEIGIFDTLKVVEQAKEMEKQQIIDAYVKGANNQIYGVDLSGLEYYEQTFKH